MNSQSHDLINEKERVLLVPTNSRYIDTFRGALNPNIYGWCNSDLGTLAPEESNLHQLQKPLEQIVNRTRPTIIIIIAESDAKGNIDEFNGDLNRLSYGQLSDLIMQPTILPRSLFMLMCCERLRTLEVIDSLLIIFAINTPSCSLTQILLENGADWIWPSVTRADGITDVIETMRSLRTKAELRKAERKRIFVAENSATECAYIREHFQDSFDLVFVGSMKPYGYLQISPMEAIEEFSSQEKKGVFHAAIIDLALSDISEKIALAQLSGNERVIASIHGWKGEAKRELQNILGGLVVVNYVVQHSPFTKVFILSNYVYSPHLQSLIRQLSFTEGINQFKMLPKDFSGYKQLRDLLENDIQYK